MRRPPFVSNLGLVVLGNLLGGTLAFVYFTYLDPGGAADAPLAGWADVAFFVVTFAAIAVVGTWASRRWSRPLLAAGRAMAAGTPAPAVLTPEVRRLALSLPYRLAAISAAGWVLAGALWSILWPWLIGTFSVANAARLALGIVGVGGAVTTAFTFFAVERAWRRTLPVFFPGGVLGDLAGAPRLGVQARLTAAFLLVSLLPMVVLGALATSRARAVLGADPAAAEALLRGLLLVVAFVVAVGAVAALVLSRLVARSVAEPLLVLEAAMARVGRGQLDTTCPVVSHDELGRVTSGFNQMAQGLRERDRIKAAFGKYVTDEIRDEILAGRVGLEGETREVTILFCDLRDFTPWVEATPPAEVVRSLNGYFAEMEQAIRAEGGLVLQYIGDEIEAVFGAPVGRPDHAARAVAAARAMRERLGAWNRARVAAGQPPLAHGIGIHTGTVLAGNVGSADRLTYALVGDAVNLAARIQTLTREVGADIVISGVTAAALDGRVPLAPLPETRVKGRSALVEVFAVL